MKSKMKYLITTIISILVIVTSISIVLSYKAGDKVTLGVETMTLSINKDTDRVYCGNWKRENKQGSAEGVCKGTITFSEDHMYINDTPKDWTEAYAQLAWVVQNAGTLSGPYPDNNQGHYEGANNPQFSTSQKLLWTYLRNLGSEYGIDFDSWNSDSPPCSDHQDEINAFAKEIMSSSGEGIKLTSSGEGGGESTKAQGYDFNGENYMKVGPIQISMSEGASISSYQVTLEDGSTVSEGDCKFLNVAGEEIDGTTIGNDTGFYIIVKSSSLKSKIKEVTVTGKATSQYFAEPASLELFESTSYSFQNLLKTHPGRLESKETESSATIQVEQTEASITIKKFAKQAGSDDADVGAGQLPGAVFKIKKQDSDEYINASGTGIDGEPGVYRMNADTPFVGDGDSCSFSILDKNTGITIKGVPAGSYEVIEAQAPEGYDLLEEPLTFTVSEDGMTVTPPEVHFVDERKGPSIVIEKQDADGNPLAGATFSLFPKGTKAEATRDVLSAAKEVHSIMEQRGFTYSTDNVSKTIEESIQQGKATTSCSVYVDWVLHKIGLSLPSVYCPDLYNGLMDQQSWCTRVSQEQMVPGDLVVWNGHIQIYNGLSATGKTQWYNAGSTGAIQDPPGRGVDLDASAKIYHIIDAGSGSDTGMDLEKSVTVGSQSTWTTGSDGKVTITGVEPGEYTVAEITAPSGYEKSEETFDVSVTSGDTQEYTVGPFVNNPNGEPKSNYDPNKKGFRKIIKDSSVGLEAFEFELYEHSISEEYPEILSSEYYSGASDDAFNLCTQTDTVETSEDGSSKCSLHGQDPSHAEKWNQGKEQFNQDVEEKNEYHRVRKEAVDAINERQLITDADGYGNISDLNITGDDQKGKIDITETSVGSNPYFNLKNDDGSDRQIIDIEYWSDNVIMENERKRVDIEGYIWEDVDHGKDALKDALKQDDEELVQPIEIQLKNGGQTIATGVVTGNGRYRIRLGGEKGENIKYVVDKGLAAGTYIEFTFNGIVYKSVPPKIDEENGSKAQENPDERASLDNDYSTISANTGSSSKSARGSVEYNRNTPEQYKSETRYEGSVSGDLTRNEKESEPIGDGTYDVTKMPGAEPEYEQQGTNPRDDGFADDCYYINSQSSLGKYQIHADTLRTGYSGFVDYTTGDDTIKNVNLGLEKREQPDLAVQNDIYQVKVTYDGHEYTYQYGKGLPKESTYESRQGDVSVKFQNNKGAYTREVYPSDVEIVPANRPDDAIKIYVIYKTAIYNESTGIQIRPTQLVSHYDSDYRIPSKCY